jgi:hypothetical protein
MDSLLATRIGKFYLLSVIIGFGFYFLHQILEPQLPAICNYYLDPFLVGFTLPGLFEIGIIISKTKAVRPVNRIVFIIASFVIIEFGLPEINTYFIADPLDLGITLLSFFFFLISEHRISTEMR